MSWEPLGHQDTSQVSVGFSEVRVQLDGLAVLALRPNQIIFGILDDTRLRWASGRLSLMAPRGVILFFSASADIPLGKVNTGITVGISEAGVQHHGLAELLLRTTMSPIAFRMKGWQWTLA